VNACTAETRMDTAISTSTGRSATVPADLRNDGLTDIVAGEWVVVSVLFNQVTGKFVDGLWVPLAGSGNCGRRRISTATVNRTWLFPRRKAFALASTIAMNPGILALGDFNHDGKPDVADSSNQLAL
jgi:hypothetical protein